MVGLTVILKIKITFHKLTIFKAKKIFMVFRRT